MNDEDFKKLDSYLARVFKTSTKTPPLSERRGSHSTYEAFDPVTGKVYAWYGDSFRKAVREMVNNPSPAPASPPPVSSPPASPTHQPKPRG